LTSHTVKIAALVAVAVGVQLAGVWHLLRSIRLLRSGVRKVGLVVAISDPTDRAAPVVEFADPDGVTHRVTLPLGGLAVAVGDAVPVVYPPGRPERACQPSVAGLWLVPVGCLAVGGTLLLGVLTQWLD
jgi:hypothetical protein